MATTETVKKTGIVLRVTQMKESDAMVNAIGPDGLFSFYAHGIGKTSSKNSGAVQPLAFANYLCTVSSNRSLTLKEASSAKLLMNADSLNTIAVDAFLVELTSKVVQEDIAVEAYEWLSACLTAIQNGAEPLTAGLLYFAHILELNGTGLNVSECVSCSSKKNIVCLSYQEGGYICEDCFDPSFMEKTPTMTLKMLRYFFKAPCSDFGRVNFTPEECLPIYARLFEYLDEMTGVQLTSADLISKI